MPPDDWVADAACVSIPNAAELFQPGSGRPGDDRTALRICAACPVLEPCREWALGRRVFGIAGGMTMKERRAERHRRRTTT